MGCLEWRLCYLWLWLQKRDIKPSTEVLELPWHILGWKIKWLGFNLHKSWQRKKNSRSHLLHPLAMQVSAYNGATGETRGWRWQKAQHSGDDGDRLNENNQAPLYFLTSTDPKLTLNIANSIWIRGRLKFSEAFVRTVKQDYQADAQKLISLIPSRMMSLTNGLKMKLRAILIRLLLLPIILVNDHVFDEWSRLILAEPGAVLLKRILPAIRVLLWLMDRAWRCRQCTRPPFWSLKTASFQALRLPYGEWADTTVLFLPNEDSSLSDFQQQLNQSN